MDRYFPYHERYVKVFFALLFAITYGFACAQSLKQTGDSFSQIDKYYFESDTIPLEEVVIRGPLIPRSLKSIPSNIARLTSANIEADGAIALVEKLNQVPGIYAHTGALNTSRITIRGVGSRTPYGTNRIKTYWNGIPISEGDGSSNIDDLDPRQIGSINIIRGTKSALYGMGLGGVLLIASGQPKYTGFKSVVGLEMGDFGTMKPYLSVGYGKNKTGVVLKYSNNKTDGWRQNSAYKRNNVGGTFTFHGDKFTTRFFFQLLNIYAEIPSSLNERTFITAPDSAASNWLAVNGRESYAKVISGIQFETMLSKKLSNNTTVFLLGYSGEEIRPFNILDDSGMLYGVRSVFEWGSEHLHLKTGLELIQNNYTWTTFEIINGEEGELINRYSEIRLPYSIFIQASYDLFDTGVLEMGVSYNNLSYSLEELGSNADSINGSYAYKPVFSPFVGINLPLGNKLRLYGSVAHGFSPPTVEETLLPEGIPNTSLRPESGWNFDAGVRFSAFNNSLFIDGTVYWMTIKDLLVTKRISEDIFLGDNAGRSSHLGFELQTFYNLYFKNNIVVNKTGFNLSYTANNHTFVEFTDDNVNYSGNYLPGIPRQNILLGLNVAFLKGIYLNYSFAYHGKQFLNDYNSRSYAGYSLSNLKFGINLKGKLPKNTHIYIGAKNIFNEHYASMILINAPSFGGAPPRYYYPGLPRYFYGGLSISL